MQARAAFAYFSIGIGKRLSHKYTIFIIRVTSEIAKQEIKMQATEAFQIGLTS